MKPFITLLFILLTLSSAFASKTSSIAFEKAAQLEKSSRYDEAILQYQEIERTFPYSSEAKKSKLKIADVHFLMENFAQAQYQYQYYFNLHSTDSNSDYALYRVGLSLYKQLPKTIDRDLTKSSEVLKSWRDLLVKFPQSKYTSKILTLQKELLKKLGSKELYIANFYLKNKKYISAQARFNKLFTQFPAFKKDLKALELAKKCAQKLEDEHKVKIFTDLIKKAQL